MLPLSQRVSESYILKHNVFVYLGATPAIVQSYSWILLWNSIYWTLGDHMERQGSNPGRIHARKCPTSCPIILGLELHFATAGNQSLALAVS